VAAWPMWRDMNMSKLAWRACRHISASTPADCNASKNSFAYLSKKLDGRRSCVMAGEWKWWKWRCRVAVSSVAVLGGVLLLLMHHSCCTRCGLCCCCFLCSVELLLRRCCWCCMCGATDFVV
jgi:hypothetical protein